MESEDILEKVQNDVSSGEKGGVQGTPSFFLNGRRLESYEAPVLVREILRVAKP